MSTIPLLPTPQREPERGASPARSSLTAENQKGELVSRIQFALRVAHLEGSIA